MKVEDYPDSYDCLVNIVNKDNDVWERYFSSWKDFNMKRGSSLPDVYRRSGGGDNIVKWHKDVLGSNWTTYISWNQRRYCWDFDGWCVIVHNVKGISIELDREKSPEEALEVWEKYKRMMVMENIGEVQ
jgi:hypothetical protein